MDPGPAAGARALELGAENPDIPGVSSKVDPRYLMAMMKNLVRVCPPLGADRGELRPGPLRRGHRGHSPRHRGGCRPAHRGAPQPRQQVPISTHFPHTIYTSSKQYLLYVHPGPWWRPTAWCAWSSWGTLGRPTPASPAVRWCFNYLLCLFVYQYLLAVVPCLTAISICIYNIYLYLCAARWCSAPQPADRQPQPPSIGWCCQGINCLIEFYFQIPVPAEPVPLPAGGHGGRLQRVHGAADAVAEAGHLLAAPLLLPGGQAGQGAGGGGGAGVQEVHGHAATRARQVHQAVHQDHHHQRLPGPGHEVR